MRNKTVREMVLSYLKRVKNGKTGPEIAEKLSYKYESVKRELSRMYAEGEIDRDENGYIL